MELTFQKYRVPYLFVDDPLTAADWQKSHHLFMPDQVLDAVHQALAPVWDTARKNYLSRVQAGTLPSLEHHSIKIADPILTWCESASLVRQMLSRIDPTGTLEIRFDEFLAKEWIKSKPVEPGSPAGGVCRAPTEEEARDGRPATVEFAYDQTVNDPVYLAHEFGHFLESCGSQGHGAAPKNITEIQAFFLQHAFYDPVLNPGRGAGMTAALRQHQQAETMFVVRGWNYQLELLEQSRKLSPADKREGTKGYGILDEACKIHLHRPAMIVAAGLYQRFSSMGGEERAGFLRILYGWHRDGALNQVLKAVGVNDQAALDSLAQEGVQALFKEAQKSLSPEPPPKVRPVDRHDRPFSP